MARLRRSDCSLPGISRRRRGKGFRYSFPDGTPVDPATEERITSLAIPPAWRDVWISPFENGHIQAVGTDAAGRRQYRYHDAWRRQRDLEKFERMVRFGRRLPSVRRRLARDLALPGYPKEKVLAAAVRLLDVGYFRIGGEEYAEEHETFGLSTMERRHVRVSGSTMHFDYPAKGGLRRQVSVVDRDVAPIVKGLDQRRGGGRDHLLAWKEDGRFVDVKADDVNAYLKDLAGEEFSAKDFRTWSATVLAAVEVALSSRRSTPASRRVASAVCRQVSSKLGNSPAVCRASYVDPRVFDRFEAGESIAHALGAGSGGDAGELRLRHRVERAVIELLAEEAAPQVRKRAPKPSRRRAASSSASPSSTSRSKEGSSSGPTRCASPTEKAA